MDNQFGFRKHQSTIQAVSQLLGHVNSNMNTGLSTVALFRDLKKAFDCLQYPVLLKKIAALNVSQQVTNWLSSYLSNRIQSIAANGVPQGSILGPLLYLVYANDIGSIITKSKFTLYADDTVIYSRSKDINKGIANVQHDLNSLTAWCTINRIFINPIKTKFVIFSTQIIAQPHPLLTIDNVEVQCVAQFNYLGMTLDQHLTFKNHAQHTINKVSAKIYQLRKMRKFLSQRAALLIYKNMILPIMEYGDIFMLSVLKELRNRLQKLQNKALKCALNKEKRYNTKALHTEAKILKLKHRRALLQTVLHAQL